MARVKNGTPTGFKDSTGVEIKVGDKLKGPTGIGTVMGTKVHFPDGRSPLLADLIKNQNEYFVTKLKPVEKPKGAAEPNFIPGQIVVNEHGIGYFKGVTKSETSADVICFWNKDKDTVYSSWVATLKSLRWPSSEEEIKLFEEKLIKVGLSLDKKNMQAKKVEPEFKEGDWVKFDKGFGCVKSWNKVEVELEWALIDGKIEKGWKTRVVQTITLQECLDVYRQIVLAGYSFSADWRIMELRYLLSNETKDKVGSKEITISEVASLVRASKKEELHGEFSLKLTF